jgi:hypothetical protein
MCLFFKKIIFFIFSSSDGGWGVPPKRSELESAAQDAWVALQGNVYNVTTYMDYHPGGIPTKYH